MAVAALLVGRVSRPMEAAVSSGKVFAQPFSWLRDLLCRTNSDDSVWRDIVEGSFFIALQAVKRIGLQSQKTLM